MFPRHRRPVKKVFACVMCHDCEAKYVMQTLFCPHRELEGVNDSEALRVHILNFVRVEIVCGVVWCCDGDVA